MFLCFNKTSHIPAYPIQMFENLFHREQPQQPSFKIMNFEKVQLNREMDLMYEELFQKLQKSDLNIITPPTNPNTPRDAIVNYNRGKSFKIENKTNNKLRRSFSPNTRERLFEIVFHKLNCVYGHNISRRDLLIMRNKSTRLISDNKCQVKNVKSVFDWREIRNMLELEGKVLPANLNDSFFQNAEQQYLDRLTINIKQSILNDILAIEKQNMGLPVEQDQIKILKRQYIANHPHIVTKDFNNFFDKLQNANISQLKKKLDDQALVQVSKNVE